MAWTMILGHDTCYIYDNSVQGDKQDRDIETFVSPHLAER